MHKLKEILVFFVILLTILPTKAGKYCSADLSADTTSTGISQDENILYNMINDMRVQSKLPTIPLSPELCKVAQVHIADLIKYKPQDRGCSLHSWSGSGKWTACCNTKEVFGIQCMKSKPREITGYKGDGYELIYWGEDKATPADAATLWKQVDASADMILSRAKWIGYEWKAMGVGIHDGYAILWLGDSVSSSLPPKPVNNTVAAPKKTADPVVAKAPVVEKEVARPKTETRPVENKVAETTVKKQPVVIQKGKFYVIAGSFKTAEAANAELSKIKSKGFPSSYVVEAESLFRIAIAVYDTKDKADAKKNELKDTFPGVWVYVVK
jgi:cell division septation protein DedD